MDVLTLQDLEAEWLAEAINHKREEGLLREIVAHSAPARNPQYAGGESRILKLLTAHGRHIGTIHEILMPDGSTPHSHPKDYTRRDCSRVRVKAE